MSTGHGHNSAYAGEWEADNGQSFTVAFTTGSQAAENRHHGIGPKLAGWYWQRHGATHSGRRHTSSRAAYRHAIDTLTASNVVI